MTPLASSATLDVPAGCIRIFRPPGGERAPARGVLPVRHRIHQTVVLELTVILMYVVVAAVALVSAPFGHEQVLTARSDPLNAVTAAPSPAAAAQVVTAYTAFFPALTAAEPQSQARAAAILARYATQPYLGHVLTQMAWYRAHDEVAWGYLLPHVISVQITGSQAIVRDCQNASNAWLVNTVTGEVIPGTVGYARTYLVAVLVRGRDGRWRLTLLAHVAGPCSPVPSPS